MPTSSSIFYTAPFVLTSNAVVQAVAVKSGSANSQIVSASFVNTAAAGDGTGLLGQYYPDTFPTNAFTGTPLVRTDAVINFAWGNSAPFAGVGSSNYTVKWTGSLQPQFNENYPLTTVAAGGVRLSVNGQLLINGWTNPVATNRASVALAAAGVVYGGAGLLSEQRERGGSGVGVEQPLDAAGGGAGDPVVSVYEPAADGAVDGTIDQRGVQRDGERDRERGGGRAV